MTASRIDSHGFVLGHWKRCKNDRDDLAEILREYLRLYPAFRSMPVGAPHSKKRQEQDAQIAAENKAKALLARIDGATT